MQGHVFLLSTDYTTQLTLRTWVEVLFEEFVTKASQWNIKRDSLFERQEEENTSVKGHFTDH